VRLDRQQRGEAVRVLRQCDGHGGADSESREQHSNHSTSSATDGEARKGTTVEQRDETKWLATEPCYAPAPLL
jgi:hypothetical protein